MFITITKAFVTNTLVIVRNVEAGARIVNVFVDLGLRSINVVITIDQKIISHLISNHAVVKNKQFICLFNNFYLTFAVLSQTAGMVP